MNNDEEKLDGTHATFLSTDTVYCVNLPIQQEVGSTNVRKIDNGNKERMIKQSG
jgi:hypothetical protein